MTRETGPSHFQRFLLAPLTTHVGDGTGVYQRKPPQSCFWMTINCFDGPQTRSTFTRSTVIPARRLSRTSIADEMRIEHTRRVLGE